ncbi:MAG: putative DNA binding domain-containing protein [Deltaproteobacteria bacterium]|nr:putative DNA binding domain-containing protein [Deltaproteobacteria bacterium]MBN2671272.1 putative DNA binding domain-containing protein [Deltaproteobacteria bacterium]
MSKILTVNIEELLHCQGVESARIEFKASWTAKTTGCQILKTICAFANDLHNLNGGYIVIGVAEDNGCAVLPPKGVSAEQIDEIHKWVRGNCNRIDPEFQPIMSPEKINGQHIFVIWVPASDNRPHRAPDGEKGERKYWVRIGSESVDAEKNGVLEELLQLTARVPFDDRRELRATTDDYRETKVREFLSDIRSGLLEETITRELYRKLRIAVPVNGHDAPKNIGLLMFSEDADHWFPGSRIEIVQYADNSSGNLIEEKTFRGGIHEQLKNALAYLENISAHHIEKQPHSFRVKGWVSYPIPALREALVNAVYHRSYEESQEPVKVYLYPDRIEIISYPGPLQAIQMAHLLQQKPIPPVPARNRRIGEFLKELKLAEGRGTGLPKLFRAMRDNGSADPVFDFDDSRTYFRVTLPAHPEYVAISALRDAAHLKALGSEDDAFRRIEETWNRMPFSPTITAEYIRLLGMRGKIGTAEEAFMQFREKAVKEFIPSVANVLVQILLDADLKKKADDYMKTLPQLLASDDALDAAILSRRLGNQQKAHRYFEKAGDAVLYDSRALHEFAQTKMKLAGRARRQQNPQIRASQKRLLQEAQELLERVIQMDADKTRHGFAWRDLARVKHRQKRPVSEVVAAYNNAIDLLPNDKGLQTELLKINT